MIFNVGKLNNNTSASKVNATAPQRMPLANTYAQCPIKRPSFTSLHHTVAVQTQLNTKSDIEKYSTLVSSLDVEGRKSLDYLLKTGVLLNNKSNTRSTTLDSLYKIATEERATGLDNKTVLAETVNTIANPFKINQHFGDIPEQIKPYIVNYQTNNSQDEQVRNQAIQESNVRNSGCCVAASIEYNLASQVPAEFARIAEGLTSTDMAVNKEIDLKNISENTMDAIWLLDNFNLPYEMKEDNKAQITIAPDKNAIIRAQIQNSYKDANERSVIDVLMQSTFMNVGAQQSYNTLTDKRVGKFSPSERGLVEIEKTFTESIVNERGTTSLTFQKVADAVDEAGNPVAKLTGYSTDFNTIKRGLLTALSKGQNAIIGYTTTDENNNIVNGHEITVIGAKEAADGKLVFVCNDTDDNLEAPIEYHEDYIIPRIHHVGLSEEVVNNDAQLAAIA